MRAFLRSDFRGRQLSNASTAFFTMLRRRHADAAGCSIASRAMIAAARAERIGAAASYEGARLTARRDRGGDRPRRARARSGASCIERGSQALARQNLECRGSELRAGTSDWLRRAGRTAAISRRGTRVHGSIAHGLRSADGAGSGDWRGSMRNRRIRSVEHPRSRRCLAVTHGRIGGYLRGDKRGGRHRRDLRRAAAVSRQRRPSTLSIVESGRPDPTRPCGRARRNRRRQAR